MVRGVFARSLVVAVFAVVLVACNEEAEEQSSASDLIAANADASISTSCLESAEIPRPVDNPAAPARLSLDFEEFSYSFEEDRHRYTHNRRFKESAGVGLYIYRGRVCVEDAGVCADACVKYRVDPGASLTQRGHHVATPLENDRITLQYWARDDAGNLMTFTEEITTTGENATVTTAQ